MGRLLFPVSKLFNIFVQHSSACMSFLATMSWNLFWIKVLCLLFLLFVWICLQKLDACVWWYAHSKMHLKIRLQGCKSEHSTSESLHFRKVLLRLQTCTVFSVLWKHFCTKSFVLLSLLKLFYLHLSKIQRSCNCFHNILDNI